MTKPEKILLVKLATEINLLHREMKLFRDEVFISESDAVAFTGMQKEELRKFIHQRFLIKCRKNVHNGKIQYNKKELLKIFTPL